MLKPQKKITRKEIKRDSFLETVDKLEYSFEKNKKTYLNYALAIIAGIFIINFLLNKQSQKELNSKSALGIALVAYGNSDYESAKFQLETIASDYSGTNSSLIASFYLGKIAFEKNEFTKSKSYLNNYLNDTDFNILTSGSIKMLSEIALKENNPENALKILDRGIALNLNINTNSEFKLLKVIIFKNLGKNEIAQNILTEVLSEQDLSANIKQRSEEIVGMM